MYIFKLTFFIRRQKYAKNKKACCYLQKNWKAV